MKRKWLLMLMLVAGCSTAPVADLLDRVRPGRIGPGPYRGGVGNQHGPTIAPPAPVAVLPAVPAPVPPVPPPAGSATLP